MLMHKQEWTKQMNRNKFKGDRTGGAKPRNQKFTHPWRQSNFWHVNRKEWIRRRLQELANREEDI